MSLQVIAFHIEYSKYILALVWLLIGIGISDSSLLIELYNLFFYVHTGQGVRLF